MIANPLDDEALLGGLSSPAFGISPDALWLLRRAVGPRRHLWPAVVVAAGAGERQLAEPHWLAHLPAEDVESLSALEAMVAELREAGSRLPLEGLVERCWRPAATTSRC